MARRPPRGYLPRRVDTREVRQTFLIVCEGQQTEPNYFSSFRVPKNVVKVDPSGFNTVSLVKRAIKLSREVEYDQVWCVFDRDSFPAQHFNLALRLAEQHAIRVAYSNEAFELWYLLHFHYYDAAMSRADYGNMLNNLLGMQYRKNRDDMYDLLRSRQVDAMRNAKRLLEQYNPSNPALDNPSTTVHLLVEELNRFIF